MSPKRSVTRWSLFSWLSLAVSVGLLAIACSAPAAAPAAPKAAPANPAAPAAATAAPKAAEAAKPAAGGVDIKIGLFFPATGPAAVGGQNMRNSAELAVEQWNKSGGILGRKVVLVPGDTAGVPAQGVSLMEKFISQDKVNAVVGGFVSSAVLAAQEVSEKSKMPFVIGGSLAGAITGPNRKYTFRSYPTFAMSLPQLAEYVVKTAGKKNVANIVEQTDSGEDIRKIFSEGVTKAGGKLVANESAQNAATDMHPQLTKIKAANPDAMMVGFGGMQPMSLVIKQAKEIGLNANLVAVESAASDELFDKVGSDAEGAIMTSFFEADQANTAKGKAFVTEYRAKYNKSPDFIASKTYEAMDLLKHGIEQANDTNPEKIADALSKVKDYPGLTAPTTIGPGGQAVKPSLIVKVQGTKRVVLQ